MLPRLTRPTDRGPDRTGPARVERRGHPLARPGGGGKERSLKGRTSDPRDRRPAPEGARPVHTPPGPLKVPKVRPVHRLDRDTSGLMVFALSARKEQAL